VGKIAYTLSMVLGLAYLILSLVGLGLVAQYAAERWFGRQIPWSEAVDAVASVWWLQIVLLVALLVIIRRILIRLMEPDRRPDPVR
jgi:ABC-type nickel/cobalt efflux system permease component RcnA